MNADERERQPRIHTDRHGSESGICDRRSRRVGSDHRRFAALLVFGEAAFFQFQEFAAEARRAALALDLFLREQAEEDDFAEFATFAVPAQTIAAGARGQIVVDEVAAALMALNGVIDFPVAVAALIPSAAFEFDRISAEVAVSASLVEDGAKLMLRHEFVLARVHSRVPRVESDARERHRLANPEHF